MTIFTPQWKSNRIATRLEDIFTRPAARFFVASILVCIPGIIFIHSAYGQVMSSSNYHIQSDSVNFGGVRSTSASYTIEDTLGESATGISSSTNYVMKAGYQQMQEVVIAITAVANVTMSPTIPGVTGGTANGSTVFTVTTDDIAGYTATITASSSPALQSPLSSFADYVPGGANPDFTFSNGATASTFAFSPEGADIDQRFKDNGSACNTGPGDTANTCWDGLSTSAKTILTRTTSNTPNGTDTTIKFRASSGSSHIQVNGTYVATTTITVVAL